MFFSTYLGSRDDLPFWRDAMNEHAEWLGLDIHIESRHLIEGRHVAFGWLARSPFDSGVLIEETGEYLTVGTSHALADHGAATNTHRLWNRAAAQVTCNVIYLTISRRSGELRGAVPLATPEQLYHTSDSRGHVFGNDMRLMLRWAGLDLDPRAVYSLFQYGAISPTMTMTRGVERIPAGRRFILEPGADALSFNNLGAPLSPPQPEPDTSDLATRVADVFESILEPLPEYSVLYFSGGVDSALLAARLAEMGRTDITLVNYSFGPRDKEAQLALDMASRLGFGCEQIMYNPSDIPGMLDRIGEDYSYPFGDYASVPTNLLVQASLQWLEGSRTAVEGTGADGAFGILVKAPQKWDRLYAVPRPIRWLMGGVCRWLKLWRPNDWLFRASEIGHIVRLSARMPLENAAVISQNALDGIAYTVPPNLRWEIEEDIRHGIQDLGLALERAGQFSLLDLVHVCAGEFAAKSFDPLRRHGITPIYPFLEPAALQMSFALRWDEKWEGGEAKGLLKRMLARSVPAEWVYRRKSAFTPPIQQVMALPRVQDLLRNVVLSKGNPLLDFCSPRIVRQMVDCAREGKTLGLGSYSFLWVLMFTSRWLSALDAQHRRT